MVPRSLIRFGNIQFGIGPAGSGAPQHYHTHAYTSLFSGRKLWWFFPPPQSALSRQHAIRFAERDAAWRRGSPQGFVDQGSLARTQWPLVCEQRPGDIVYVPSEWGHSTLNAAADDGGVAISVAREFTWDAEETDSYVINSLLL
eukprot:TRINITY_DN59852_c0_g1_i1.p1 TRINITY_DN59852_c0_g1~~TRINITY_DN59852_c0_g1_i1.p1  ORF type:complete len:144 (+),score=12.29 TRINITY_DN59852_c0_g1_i1:3-434(+)